MSQASEDSLSTGCMTPDSSSQASSPTPTPTNSPSPSSSGSGLLSFYEVASDDHCGPRNRTASIDLWSADIADLGMNLARFDEHNPPSARTETNSSSPGSTTASHIERARSLYYFNKCQDLTRLLHESRDVIEQLGSRVMEDSSLVGRILDEVWAQEQSREDVSRSLATAEGSLELERQSSEQLMQQLRQHERDLAVLNAMVAHYEGEMIDAQKAEAVIRELADALRAQNRELHVAVNMTERLGGWHGEVLDNIKEAMGVGISTGNKAIDSWKTFLTELCADCRLNPDIGDAQEVLRKVKERGASVSRARRASIK